MKTVNHIRKSTIFPSPLMHLRFSSIRARGGTVFITVLERLSNSFHGFHDSLRGSRQMQNLDSSVQDSRGKPETFQGRWAAALASSGTHAVVHGHKVTHAPVPGKLISSTLAAKLVERSSLAGLKLVASLLPLVWLHQDSAGLCEGFPFFSVVTRTAAQPQPPAIAVPVGRTAWASRLGMPKPSKEQRAAGHSACLKKEPGGPQTKQKLAQQSRVRSFADNDCSYTTSPVHAQQSFVDELCSQPPPIFVIADCVCR